MFGKGFTLFKVSNFEVKVDLSWIFLAALIIWLLATGLFPYYYPKLAAGTYWWMGAFGALGLFMSVMGVELCHALVARKYGLSSKTVTLFVFGGISESDREPTNPKVDFFLAVAGPAISLLFAVLFYGIFSLGKSQQWSMPVDGVLSYLAAINLILAAFNLIPGFPLDGGRMLRSALWKAKGDLKWATRVASNSGVVFGWILIALGLSSIFQGNFIGGLWWGLIGLFVKGAARLSYQQLIVRESLKGETIRRFITQNPFTVAPSVTLDRFVEDYVYQHHFKMFPVVQDSRLLGCMRADSVKEIPKAEWANHHINEFTTPCSTENAVGPDTNVRKAISIMNRTGNSRLLVVEGQRLVGIVTLKNLLEFLALKLDLEGGEAPTTPQRRHLKVAS
jgi:Zn-dependent protease